MSNCAHDDRGFYLTPQYLIGFSGLTDCLNLIGLAHFMRSGGSLIIAMANGKGGCAKSTTSTHLVHWLALKGKKVALIDADVQATSSMWVNSLGIDVEVQSINPVPEELLETTAKLESSYDYVVIDGPGGLVEVVRCSVLVCDLAVLPIQATGPDVRAAGDALKLLKECAFIKKQAMPRALSFLTRVNPRTKACEAARNALSQQNYAPLLKSMITARQVVQDGYTAGKTSFNSTTGPGLEARTEFDQLFREMQIDG